MRAAVIINPVSGRRGGRATSGAERVALAWEVVRRTGLGDGVEIVVTKAAGHAAALARGFVGRGYDRVVAWGGDGTVNETAGPLLGSRTALGIVPSGSGDGLARGLSLPRDPALAVRLALAGPIGPIDAGFLGDRHFLNIAGIGFDAAVAGAFNRSRRRGALAYVTGSLTGVWTYRSQRYTVETDEAAFTGERFVVVFANAREYGNGLVIAPDADPCDGRLNMVVVEAGPVWRQIWRARRLAVRRDRPAGGVDRRTITRARVSGDLLCCHVDGESFEASGSLDVRVVPGAVRVAGLAGG